MGRVVVVGGGYGGVTVAKGLDRHADVTLVEPRAAFVNNVMALRALVHPEWIDRMFFPYDRLLAHGSVLHDRADLVEPGRVVLASGRVLEADHVVVATGSSYPFPAKPAPDAAPLLAAHRVLAGADRVLLVGAGAVGIELAAEIKLAWPAKSVVLLDERPTVLGATAHSDRLRAALTSRLERLGVELALGDPLAALPADGGPAEVRTASGRSIEADVWYRCFSERPAHELEVDELLRVRGQAGVWAVGDVAALGPKMAGLAMLQARVVVANVKAALRGEEPARRWQPVGPMMMVAIGADDGAGESPVGFHEGAEVAELKGRDLLGGFFAELFNLPVPYGVVW